MSVKAINPTQLKAELSKEIETYRNQVQKKYVSKEELIVLIEKILFEREILFSEIDILKEARNKWIQKNDLNEESLNLLIKEIDELLYNDFYNLSKKLDYNPGELLTSLMEDFVLKFDGAFPDFSADSLRKLMKRQAEISVSHQEQLIITNEDLLDLSKTNITINFNYIDTLEFVNVDLESFKEFVNSINHCHLVRVPETIPKLLLYTKCFQCSYFEFIEQDPHPKLDNKKLEYAREANKVVEDWKNGS
ncbi:MAG: hypothetical protein ACFFB5_10335 [Promethearchaeota archaeon]